MLQLNGPTLEPLPNVNATVTAVSTYVGIVKAVTATKITLNLKLSLADFPTGPHFPVAAGGTQTIASENIKVLNRVGNSAPFFVFPLANPYQYSGNDVIDAHLLDWADATNALPPVGLTAYGGAGNDLIIGSQTGDHLAGGSGDDTILGQRGDDHIYGDSGFNVDLITRASSTWPPSAPARPGYADGEVQRTRTASSPGNDLLYGEGAGSAPAATTTTVGNDDDIIFGDHGVVTSTSPARATSRSRCRTAAEDPDDAADSGARERRRLGDRLEGAAERRRRLDLRQPRPRHPDRRRGQRRDRRRRARTT